MKKNLQSSFDTRQYMLSKDYEIYYYSNKKMSSVKEHTHNYYEFYFFLEGDVKMYIDGKKYQMHPGDVVLIPPMIMHQAIVMATEETPYRRFVFWISQEFVQQLMQQSKDYGYMMQHVINHKEYVFEQDMVSASEIQSKVFRLLSEVHSKRFGQKAQIYVCIQDLLLLLNRKIYEEKHQSTKQDTTTLYQNLLIYIEQHLDENLSLEHLAKEFFVSKYHISHVFKENAGFSLHQYVTKKRLSLCKDAILTNSGIVDIYQQFGFSDYTSFYRAFKKEFRISPSEFQKLNQSTKEMCSEREEENVTVTSSQQP